METKLPAARPFGRAAFICVPWPIARFFAVPRRSRVAGRSPECGGPITRRGAGFCGLSCPEKRVQKNGTPSRGTNNGTGERTTGQGNEQRDRGTNNGTGERTTGQGNE